MYDGHMNKSQLMFLQLFPYVAILLFVIANGTTYWFVFQHYNQPYPVGVLKVSVLDIGQGDAILVQGPTGKTMLVDAGPDKSVLAGLGTELGPLKRSIDMIVETHPDSDHITGFKYVLQNYSVTQFMSPGIPDSTAISTQIDEAVKSAPSIQQIIARRGMRLDLGGGAYADVLYPDRDMSKETVTNDGSITMRVVYGNNSFMLTGDLPSPIEGWLIKLDEKDGELKTDVLKAGHHGSKYSTSSEWLKALSPSVVAISVGKENTYGHPATDTLARIKAQGSQIIETEDVGTIDFVSDGKVITEHSVR